MPFDASFPAQGAGEVGRRAASMVDVMRGRAAASPDRVAFTFLTDGELAAQQATYGELDRKARAIAARLQQLGAPGSRALLMYDAGLEYLAALAGCLYAGMVAVPAYPPDPMRATRTLPRLEGIVRDAQATLLLGTSSDLAWAGAMLENLPCLEALVATDAIELSLAERWTAPRIDRDTLAFLQYTSGSTGEPKGVMIQHGNVLHNLGQMEEVIDVEDAVACMWLPAYHDMGLIGSILQCWYSGRHNVLLSPVAFFQRPLRWLEAISRYRVTTTGAPDFGYDLCVRKIKPEERRDLDLSCWRLALSGAEPVRSQTIDRFVEAFAPCGVRREIFCPSFGLAEATLMVACSPKLSAPVVRSFDADRLEQNEAVAVDRKSDLANDAAPGDMTRRLVSSGRGVPRQQIAVVDPCSKQKLPNGRVGEIWVAGQNVAAGYWNRPDESAATFGAHTAAGDGPFLRTGDLGFFHEGNLYISGRLKDVIIIHGRNHYPQDIEQTVEACHEALKAYGGAAFSYDHEGQERVVIVHEVARPKRFDLDDVARIVRYAVLEAHDVLVDDVILIKQGTISKTTSGKIQRNACRQQFIRGDLQVLHAWQAPRTAAPWRPCPESYVAPRTATESLLAEAWAEVLGVDRVGAFDNFFELGGHSLLATQLVNRLSPRLRVSIPLEDLFERPTVAELAELIDERVDRQHTAQETSDRDMLDALETMSESEAQALLGGNGSASSPVRKTSKGPSTPAPIDYSVGNMSSTSCGRRDGT